MSHIFGPDMVNAWTENLTEKWVMKQTLTLAGLNRKH